MNKTDFVKAVASILRENNIRKPIKVPKQVFTFSDNEGTTKNFYVKSKDKMGIYTAQDVHNVVEAALCVIKEQMRRGEPIVFNGIGKLGVHYRKPRIGKNVKDGTDVLIPGRYIPRFEFGDILRKCARVYGMSVDDRLPERDPLYSEEDDIDVDEEVIDDVD